MFPTPKLSSWCWTSVPRERSSLPALYSQCQVVFYSVASGTGGETAHQTSLHKDLWHLGLQGCCCICSWSWRGGWAPETHTLSEVDTWHPHTAWGVHHVLPSGDSGTHLYFHLWVFSKFPHSSPVPGSDLFIWKYLCWALRGVCGVRSREHKPLHP